MFRIDRFSPKGNPGSHFLFPLERFSGGFGIDFQSFKQERFAIAHAERPVTGTVEVA